MHNETHQKKRQETHQSESINRGYTTHGPSRLKALRAAHGVRETQHDQPRLGESSRANLSPLEKGTKAYTDAVKQYNEHYGKYFIPMNAGDYDHNEVLKIIQQSIESTYKNAIRPDSKSNNPEEIRLAYLEDIKRFINKNFIIPEKGTEAYTDAVQEYNEHYSKYVPMHEVDYDHNKVLKITQRSIESIYKRAIRPDSKSNNPEEARLAYLEDIKRFIKETFTPLEKGTRAYTRAVQEYNEHYSKYISIREGDNDHNEVLKTIRRSIESIYKRAIRPDSKSNNPEKANLAHLEEIKRFIKETFTRPRKGTEAYTDAVQEYNKHYSKYISMHAGDNDHNEVLKTTQQSIESTYKRVIRPNSKSNNQAEVNLAHLEEVKGFINNIFNIGV